MDATLVRGADGLVCADHVDVGNTPTDKCATINSHPLLCVLDGASRRYLRSHYTRGHEHIKKRK